MAGSIKGMIQFLSGMMTSQESKPAWGHTLTLASLVTGRALPFSHLQVLSHGRTMTHKGGMAPCALHATWQWSPGALARPRRTFFHAKRQLCEQNRGRRFGVGAFCTRILQFLLQAKCRPDQCFENATPFVWQSISGSSSTHPC